MVNKRWSVEEEYALLDFMSSNLEQYTKGVKTKFYESSLDALPQKSATQVKSKCIELESSYKTYKAKLSRSGFGVKATDPSSIKEMLLKKCTHFYEVDEIFGARDNMVPPVVFERGVTVRNGRVRFRRGASRDLDATVFPTPHTTVNITATTPSTVSTPAMTVTQYMDAPLAVPDTPLTPTKSTPTRLPAMATTTSSPLTKTEVAGIPPLSPATSLTLPTTLIGQAPQNNATPHVAMTPFPDLPLCEAYFAGSDVPNQKVTESLSGNKRDYDDFRGSAVAKMFSQFRDERDATRAEHHKDEMQMRREELVLKQQQFEAYKAELKLKEIKMERTFALMTQKTDLQAKKMEVELMKLRRGEDK